MRTAGQETHTQLLKQSRNPQVWHSGFASIPNASSLGNCAGPASKYPQTHTYNSELAGPREWRAAAAAPANHRAPVCAKYCADCFTDINTFNAYLGGGYHYFSQFIDYKTETERNWATCPGPPSWAIAASCSRPMWLQDPLCPFHLPTGGNVFQQ